MPGYALIAVIIGALLIVAGILTQIDWYKVFNRFYGDDPRKARIYVEFGEKVDPVEGWLYGTTEKMSIYQFVWSKTRHMVQVPHKYPWRFIRGRRMIRYFPGNAWAQPLAGFNYDLVGGSRELNVTIESQTTIDMVKSVKGHKPISIIAIVVVVLAVAVGAWFLYTNMSKQNEPEPTPVEQTTQPTPSQLVPIEVK